MFRLSPSRTRTVDGETTKLQKGRSSTLSNSKNSSSTSNTFRTTTTTTTTTNNNNSNNESATTRIKHPIHASKSASYVGDLNVRSANLQLLDNSHSNSTNSISSGNNGIIIPNGKRISKLKLESIVSNKILCEELRKFMKSNFSLENLAFWQAVQTYQKSVPEDKLYDVALMIYTEFVKDGSHQQVNIDSGVKRKIEANMNKERITKSMFNVAQKEVASNMEQDTLPRFLQQQSAQLRSLLLPEFGEVGAGVGKRKSGGKLTTAECP